VEETVEAPAEAPAETRVREEFFIDTDETEVPEAEASEVEDDFDEYDLVFGTEDEPAEEPIEGSVEIEEVPEAPAEEPVVMTLPET
ncbi:MAG: hypothetical protein Q4Q58_03335, partial [Thermoplasmata archaeon]|nr:hypothetical protein [Thermoplasmata archaeon]